MYTKEDLKRQLECMNIQKTDTVLIHTSMKAIGPVENGADGVIDAFCEYLEDGLFLVPTHTWASVNAQNPVFDVTTAVPCIGALPRVAAQRKDGFRSLHPSHSIWGFGKDAEVFLQGDEKAFSGGTPGASWDRLPDRNTKILLIGVGHNRNTYIHSLDERAKLPDRISPTPSFDVTVIDAHGNRYTHPYYCNQCSKTSDVSQFYVNFEKPLIELGAQTMGKLGNADVRIVDSKLCRDIILRIYQRAEEDIFTTYRDIPPELYR